MAFGIALVEFNSQYDTNLNMKICSTLIASLGILAALYAAFGQYSIQNLKNIFSSPTSVIKRLSAEKPDEGTRLLSIGKNK